MKRIIALCIALLLLFVSCSAPDKQDKSTDTVPTEQTDPISANSDEPGDPQNSEELFSALLHAWEEGDVSDLYDYLSDDMRSLLDKKAFTGIFDDLTDTFGSITGFSDPLKKTENGVDVFSFRTTFENAYSDLTVSIKDIKIAGIVHDDRITNTFELKHESDVSERYFLLQSGEYELNAVYTFKEGTSPAVLLVPGSGPLDYNETVGILRPFRDIALGLAENGVNSLRLEKRTFRYADSISEKDGIDEEYLNDFTAALDWLKMQDETECVFLLGHSLGGQIASELSKENDVEGLILWNSSPRHLAEISADQFSALDEANESVYRLYESKAKQATKENSEELYYFGASDYYWASYNQLYTVETLKKTDVLCLVLNSKGDTQVFPEDLELWQSLSESKDNMLFKVYEAYSHFGYIIDTSDQTAVYRQADFPGEIIEDIVDFIIKDEFH